MSWQQNLVGALALRTDTFLALRARSDVFRRGFIVLLVAGLIAGAFAALPSAISKITPLQTEEDVVNQAVSNFRQSFRGPAQFQEILEPTISQATAMGYELAHLPPRAGEGARPISALLRYIGTVLATPFGWNFMGWTLLAGLVFHFSSRLMGGRASMAQMLGLTALATAPQILSAITSLLGLVVTATGASALGGLASLLGLLISVWGAAIYVKATAIAQDFSLWHALGAIALGLVLLLGVFLVAVVLIVTAILLLVLPVSSRVQ